MDLADYRALTAPKASGKGKTKARPSDEPTAAEITARAEVVGVGRLAWENTAFGLPAFYRKYRLLSAAHAEALDAEFYRLTGTAPPSPATAASPLSPIGCCPVCAG